MGGDSKCKTGRGGGGSLAAAGWMKPRQRKGQKEAKRRRKIFNRWPKTSSCNNRLQSRKLLFLLPLASYDKYIFQSEPRKRDKHIFGFSSCMFSEL